MSSITVEKNKISMLSCIMLCCTCMVGSGWLFSSQLAAKNAGIYAFLAWIAAAGIILSIAYCLAKVVADHPTRGATTRISAISHNATFAMPFAFANWFGVAVVIATEAQATAQYLAPFFDDKLMVDGSLTWLGKGLGLLLLVGYLLINWYGIKLLAKVNNIVTALKIFTPCFVIAVLLGSHFDTSNLTYAGESTFTAWDIFPAIIASGMIYAFNGFQVVASFASEMKDPKRNMFRVMLYSVLIVLGFYLLLQLAFMTAFPHSSLTEAGGWAGVNLSSPIVGLTIMLGLNFLMLLLMADSVIAPSAVGYTYLGTSSRMLFAMSKEKQVPGFISKKICPKRGIAIPSMLINFIISVIFLLQASSWSGLMVIVTMLHIIGYLAAPISMAALKPKTRIFGGIVFIIVAALINTVSSHDLLVTNLVMTGLILLYIASQGIAKAKINLLFSTPFLTYAWLIYTFHNISGVIVISLVFFILVTNKHFVAFAQRHRNYQEEVKASDTIRTTLTKVPATA
jgi:amino acid transporter